MSNLAELTDTDFQSTIESASTPVLIDFHATWCQPCKSLTPLIEAIAEEYAGKLEVRAVDIENAGETAMRFGIQSVPTVVLFKNGQEVDRFIGLRDIKSIREMVDKAIG